MTLRSTVPKYNAINTLLWMLRNGNMAVTTDQAFTKQFAGTLWLPTHVLVKRVTGAFGTACAGGVYTAATKGGNAIVAAAQVYTALTGANTGLTATLALTGPQTSTSLFLSLTTGNTGALTADFFVFGVVVD